MILNNLFVIPLASNNSKGKLLNFLSLLLLSCLLICTNFHAKAAENESEQIQNQDSCDTDTLKATLNAGWEEWKPYVYEKTTSYGQELTGLDIELLRVITKKIGVDLSITKTAWDAQVSGIKDGEKDVATAATFSKERSKFAYFSTPYRFEESSLFTSKKSLKKLNFDDIPEFLAQMRGLNYRIGIQDGVVLAEERLNRFINDPLNQDLIVRNSTDLDSLAGLIKGEIDGFIADRLSGSAMIIQNQVGDLVQEIELDIKAPLSLMLSKKTIPFELLDKINDAINQIKTDGTYNKIVKQYLYPILLMQTTSSKWYYYVTLLGVIAFALSGVAIAAKDNMTLFGTVILAILPSIGGSIIGDFTMEGEDTGLANSTFYIGVILAIVLICFSFVRILDVFNKGSKDDKMMQTFWQNFFVLTDALGQACFIVTGVSAAIIAKFSPLEIWGPLFAFVIANGGTMLRDLYTKDKHISVLSGDINAEVSLVWGFIFAVFLTYNSDSPNITVISTGAILVIIGAFSTRLATIYFNIPNVRFR